MKAEFYVLNSIIHIIVHTVIKTPSSISFLISLFIVNTSLFTYIILLFRNSFV
jgi:hypothetical protein